MCSEIIGFQLLSCQYMTLKEQEANTRLWVLLYQGKWKEKTQNICLLLIGNGSRHQVRSFLGWLLGYQYAACCHGRRRRPLTLPTSAAGASDNSHWLRTDSCLCTRTTRAGFFCITMQRDYKRAAHTTCVLVLTSETLYGHVVSDFITKGMHKYAMNMY
jgi:hypothetical protein